MKKKFENLKRTKEREQQKELSLQQTKQSNLEPKSMQKVMQS